MKNKLFSFRVKKLGKDLAQNDRLIINALKYGISIVLFLLCGSVLILLQGQSPIAALEAIFQGAFGNKMAIGNTLRWTAPCIMTGAAAIVAFKAGVSNLGIAGQVTIGGFLAGLIGAFYELPPLAHITLIIVVAGVAGLLWSVVPAILRLFFNINEFITSLMLNYVANFLTQYLTQQVLAGGLDSWGYVNMEATPTVLSSAVLPDLIHGTSATLAVPIALIVAIAIAFLYKYTIQGYELKQVGENLKFAKVGGVKVVKQFLIIFLLSGFISGMCGGIEVIGTYKKFNTGFADTMGWDGISIARIAELNPIALIFVSFIWAALKAGAMQMERVISVNRLTVQIVQYLFVLFVSVDYEGIYLRAKERRAKKQYRKEMESVA
ncbi:ABC transporter permease [Anaerofilum sp. BX8]|uniref:ABC transporter permease n=1 Tax=Anaerofilum hominis TaxID=2763016 RepID=A0A923I6V7_9FIRM|nr:ABC transporter permease [Anaerofilum hominis]MBC5581380.1 ABC transporter permease [Anaerofilum hominis]